MGQGLHFGLFLPFPRLVCLSSYATGPPQDKNVVSVWEEVYHYYASSKEYNKGTVNYSYELSFATQVSFVGPQ